MDNKLSVTYGLMLVFVCFVCCSVEKIRRRSRDERGECDSDEKRRSILEITDVLNTQFTSTLKATFAAMFLQPHERRDARRPQSAQVCGVALAMHLTAIAPNPHLANSRTVVSGPPHTLCDGLRAEGLGCSLGCWRFYFRAHSASTKSPSHPFGDLAGGYDVTSAP